MFNPYAEYPVNPPAPEPPKPFLGLRPMKPLISPMTSQQLNEEFVRRMLTDYYMPQRGLPKLSALQLYLEKQSKERHEIRRPAGVQQS